MLKINYSDLCSLDFMIKPVNAAIQVTAELGPFSYESSSRPTNLIYYCIEGQRKCLKNGVEFLTIKENDIFFAPRGASYTSVPTSENSKGFGICFDICLHDNTPVIIDEDPVVTINDETKGLFKSFLMIHYCFLNKHTHLTKLKAEMFSLIDRIFTKTNADTIFESIYKDVYPAIDFINKHPGQYVTNEDLAKRCYMSTSSFMRKFKLYTGGQSPGQYRDYVRFTKAEEMTCSSDYTLSEIAEILGFYDASHLCRKYKLATGHTLKNGKTPPCIVARDKE